MSMGGSRSDAQHPNTKIAPVWAKEIIVRCHSGLGCFLRSFSTNLAQKSRVICSGGEFRED